MGEWSALFTQGFSANASYEYYTEHFLALTFLQVLVFGQAVGSREMTLDAFPADVT